MKKILRKMMSFVMAVFMVLQVMLPAFASSSKAEEEKPNSIKGLEEMKDDADVYFSILKSQGIYDKSKKKKDENKFSIAISMPDTTSQFRLIKRNDLKLYEDGYFDTNEKASKEYWRVKDMLNSQGLDLDLEIIKEDQGYKIVTKDQLEKLEEDENKNIYGQNYSYIDLKIMDDFDFNEKGIQKLFDEDKLLFNLEFIKYTSLDPNFELYEKDEKGNLKIKNQGDLFALIREDKIKLYNTNSLEEDYNKLKAYKEEKQTEQQKAKDEKEQENAPSQSQEEKVQDEKSSSNKENLSQDKKEQKNKEDTKENKESKTEVQVESKENTKENTENKDNKDSTKEPKKEEQKEKSSQKTQTQEKSEDKKEKKTTEKKGLLPKLRMLFLGQDEPAKPKLAKADANALADKKFTINTRFDTSNRQGPIKVGQYFNIHLDEKLKVNDPSTLKPIYYNGKVIATPKYDEANNTIKYYVTQEINENIQVPLKIPVDYNTDKITIGNDGTFTVTNKVSGPGVQAPKNLVPQKIDKNGNPAGSIIETGRDDVIKIIDDENGNYQVPIDITGDPVVENGEMVGINWNMKVHADQSLNTLGFMANFTTVEGSGLGEIEKVLLNGKEVTATDQLEKALGIVDSKHHKVTDNTQEASYSFYTPVTNKQEKYMIDVSVYLKSKKKAGAVRFVFDQGYPKEKIEEATPTRVGINNRTTIQGKFLANDKAQWTITDAISSGDEKNGGMPLADRTLDGDQSVTSGKSAVYGLDENGNMVVKENEKDINSIPAKETDPQGTQAVGNIAVYKLDTQLTNSDKPSNYNISGVRISKFRDLYIDQVWNFPVDGMTMPGQKFIAKDKNDNTLGEVHVDEGAAGETTRFATIPNARYWDIDGTTHEPSKRGNKIVQEFDKEDVEVGGKTYKYNENANYYQIDTKSQYIQNSAIDITKPNPVTFTVVKVDSNDPSKKLEGAKFKLLGDNQPSIITDSQGKATFNNVLPGRYTLVEEKAPAGYKLDQSQKTINISEDGDISVDGNNIQLGGGKSQTKLVQHNDYPNWPDYMNAMHYGKISDNGDLEFYLYLKPQSNNGGGGTNRNTRLNISIPGVNITDVKAYDVSPGYRQNVKYSMEKHINDQYIPLLGNNVINAQNNNVITGTPNKQDPYTGKTGYQIYFPQERFANDWGFLVKVKANIGDKQSVSLDYDWLTDEDTANQTNLTQKVALSKNTGADEPNQLIVTNEEFTKSPITITKFGDTFDTEGKRNKLQGAEFVLKDSTGKILANKFTNDKGTADFGQYPPGTYRLEEAKAPDGHQKNGVYFEVVVDEQGQVKYNARFEDGNGTPETGRDYYIEKGKETGTSGKAKVTNVNQRLEYLENEPGDIGVQTGVWEAYSYESLKYHADVTLDNSAPGTRFEIQFDRNFDFTQYFSEFPKVVIDGEEVADPYFDYNTNLLTYVFNEKSKGGTATASINLRGIIPDKYYAKETGEYPFTIKVAPGVADVGGNPVLNKTINADYGRHHSKTGDSNQSYYFRDVYQKEDGKWYVTVLTYLNPLGLDYSAKTVKYNWITTDFQSNRIAEWSGKGYKPLYELNDVKVYGTDYAKYWLKGIPLNRYMPLSMGIRPEQEPNIYHLLAHQSINPAQGLNRRENDITIKYDPNQITTSDKLNAKAPLTIQTPKPKDKGGYVVEQTFKITDIEQFNKKWRAFLMNDGNLTSAFASKANVNTAIGDQAGGEIPKYYKEIIGLINHKYTPGSFKLTKYDETNQGKKLQNATFALKDENGKVIYRTSDSNGEVNFDNIAPGRYSLEETRAPKGYQLTNKKWQVTILNDGSVRIRETSVTGESKLYTGDNINIQVSNRPAGQKFRVYKKDGDGRPLPGAKFKISDPDNNDPNFPIEATSDQNGIVEFNGTPQENKNYVLEEVEPPTGYNKLNKKWVLRVENGKTKIYNYSENAEGGQQVQSILGEEGVEWVDVKNRNTAGWSNYDNRWTGWAGNNQNAQFLGTRIVGINKKDNYVIQRYVINPEARNIADKTIASIHRQALNDPNMDWFNENNFDKNNDIKIFKLYKPVKGLISDIRLANYKAEDISASVTKTPEAGRVGEPNRLKLGIPATDKPIVIDIKVPYKDENGGVGTGLDWINGNQIYWKADFYERVSTIKTTGPTTGTTGTILGSYVGEDSLDVTNDIKTYGFKLKKLKEDKTTVIPGAVFKLTGPEPLKDERFMTTGKDGMISFNGLKPGKYKLEEEKPAPGYENPNTTWTVRVASDGKVYIKEDNKATDPKKSSVTVSTNANIARNNLMRRLQMAGANTDLEIGGNLVDTLNPLRAGNGWEVVDPDKSEGRASIEHSNNLIATRITEINKDANRFKQVFLLTDGSPGKERLVQLHRQPENAELALKNGRTDDTIVKVYKVNASNIDDALNGTKTSFNITPSQKTPSGKPRRVEFSIPGSRRGYILVEVETSYNGALGLGADYKPNRSDLYGSNAWAGDSYSSEDGVNKNVGPVITYEEREVRTEIPIPAEPIRRPNDQMYEGEENEVYPGKAGYNIDIYKYKVVDGVDQPNPEFVRNKETVQAEPKIIEYGTKKKGPEQRTSDPVTLTEEIPFEIQESVDENLKPGEVVIDTQGKKGSVQYKYSITYEKSEGESAQRPDDWPDDAPKAQPQAGERVISYNKTEVEGTRVNPTTQIVRKGPAGAEEGEIEIPSDGFAQITNKQTGLDLKIYKKASNSGNKLEGALFTIKKTDENFQNPDTVFGTVKGKSNADGLVEFKDKDGNLLRLPVGYYLIEETAAPLGYRKPNAPWKVQVVEKDGKLVAKYIGPEDTPQSFIEKNNTDDISIKEKDGVKYATKITHIDTESRSFIQRLYIDTRGKQGTVNVQITPKHKREEIDRAGLPPVTIKEGVKTAYRSTYKISGINGDPNEAQMIKILNDYDVATPNVTVVNTARWRPFDWGFDEDQLNLEPGVYYIDIEGFYDTSIIDRNVTNEVAIDSNYNFTQKDGVTPSKEPVLKDRYVNNDKNDLPDEDLGKIDIDIQFFDGARKFYQRKFDKNINKFVYDTFEGASYQGGIEAVRQRYEDKWYDYYIEQGYEPKEARKYAITKANNWANSKSYNPQKYVNALSKHANLNGTDFIGGYIDPTVDKNEEGYVAPSSTISTSMDIKSLYSSNKNNVVPQEGLEIENDAERYNITFSKHGKETDTSELEDITKKRLEGAVFKLEKRVREGIYEELEGSYVSSAFNGYFGFRGLEPGRYRLVEVQAPKGYKPINGPLLYFSVETVSLVSQKIVDPRTGEAIDVNTVEFYFPGNTTPYKFENLEVHDPVTNKVIKFMKAKNVDLDTTKIIDPTDSTKKTEVSLKELSIKFPGEIKNKEGEVVKDTYKISEIQITPTSNGYISLEYDKANGVYQYIKEKSTTEENGLLVDYVTSATAKNMGKIVNEKPGKGSVTINKVDEKGNALKGTANDKGELTAGAKFRLTNLTDGSTPVEKTVGTDGKLSFEGLKIGNYKLEEIESPDGHINTKQVWHFTVGGEGLDPYSGEIARTGKNLSDKITLETTEMKVLNPKYETPTKDGEIYPHNGESMEFTNKFKLAENTKINPGDYFELKTSDNIDLHGIFENSVSNLDIVADGVGTIAKADYDREAGKIIYTFTKYADTYTLIDFSNKLTAFIDLYEVKKSDTALGGQKVGFGIGEDTSQYKDIKVVYELKMEKHNNGYDYLNMTSKIVKYNQETGEFLHYFYINRDKENARTNYFYYIPSQDVENVVITKYKLVDNTDVKKDMPESFGVNENSTNIKRSGYGVSRQSMAKGELLELPFENGTSSRDSYIVKVTGRVSGKDKSSYQAESVLQRYVYYEDKLFVDRFDGVYGFKNKATGNAKLSIQAVNPSNIIKFKKINNSNEALKGAIFQLYKNNDEGKPDAYGQPITTGKDGLIEYSKLPKGEYQLKETTAPEGYVKPEGPLAEFKVDESGNIFRKEYYKDKNGQTQEKYVEEPGVVPIELVNEKEHEIVFKKVDAADKSVLEGAEFEVLYKQDKDAQYKNDSIKLYKNNDGTIYAFKADEAPPTGYTKLDKLTSGKDGLVKFKVKSNGYYALKETKAPDGYLTPKGYVKEFVVKDGKVQEEKYLTSMDVKKTTGFSMANDVFQKSYATNMTLRFNPNHEEITYQSGKSTLTLSNLPLKSEIWDNKFNAKQPLSITAYLVDGDKEYAKKTITLDLTKDYNTNLKASKTIDLYSLVKELENQTTDGDIKSNKTLVLSMSTSLYLKSELDIKSNIVIGDKIKEDRTFHIGTKGDEYVDHSYKFTNMKEIDSTKPIEIENRKLSLPFTRGIRAWIGFTIIGLILMILAAYYYNKKKNKALEIEKN
ncbi:MAG: SpaA isopeptide-forming pilin-related protein [Anaerococcus vaginalis]|uniref:SpaA isopeptide-forming pilin-related protein n=1 Tax=Anaerococcus vaginalis TaxID=33037 RepID=UPI0029138582|nr:SpaA isopeptide-forming pilin-related protein [Anaerococcus vaginalis]MDU7650304.1 SpaA isopeptide-forming pilin-related protein [Anaerococcus vaginalis]